MLLLDRRVGEIIVIEDNIIIKVVTVTRNKVKLGFSAPESSKIMRLELLPQEKIYDIYDLINNRNK